MRLRKSGCLGEGGKKEVKLGDFSKQFFPRRVKLTLEGIHEKGGYNRSGEPVPVFWDFEGAD